MKKRGQITIFVILGIVLILLVGLFLYVKSSLQTTKIGPIETSWQDTLTPSRISGYVDNCLTEISREAFVKLGSTGGFMNPESQGFFAIPSIPTLSTALEVFPGGNLMVPYWYYLDSSNDCDNCVFKINLPFLTGTSTSIQSQVNNYIVNNIDSCINNFESFKNEDFVIKKIGNTTANVEFSDGYVLLQLEYPISITTNSQTIKVRDFNSKLDLDFKRIYNLAVELLKQTELNINTNTFERFTRQIIDYYSIGDDMLIPPIEGPTDISFSAPRVWLISDIQNNLERAISENIAYNQVLASKRHKIYSTNNTIANNIFSNFQIGLDYDINELQNIKIDFNYLPWWNLYVKVKPGNGGVVMPETSFNTFPIPIGLQKYKFSYDVSYPVLVNLEDTTAFEDRGYTFQYAFEVNLRNNNPLSTQQINITLPEQPQDSMFANYNQRLSDEVTVKVVNSKSLMPLTDVIVSYQCVDESVMVGPSKMTGGNAIVKQKLPICLNGIITGFKPGYFAKGVSLSTAINKSAIVTLEMEPVTTLKLNVKKIPVVKELTGSGLSLSTQWVFKDNVSLYLDNDETLILTFKKQTVSGQADFVRFYSFNGSDTSNKNIELVSGEYKLEGLLLLDLGENKTRNNITIPPKDICYDTEPLNPFGGEECVTIDEMVFNTSLLVGGVLFDNSTSGYFNVTSEELNNNTKLTIFLSGLDVSGISEMEDLEQLNKYTEYSTTHKEAMIPKFE